MGLAQAFPFVHPAIAGAALAAGAIPILIHFIHRRRYRRVPWAAMSFLMAASRQSAKRLRLEQFLLLTARIGLIVLFGLAVARPFVPASGWLAWQPSNVHRVILLDNSLSMSGKRGDGMTRFAAAKQCAGNLISSFPPGDAISLITLADPAEKRIGQPSYDHRLAREQLANVEATQKVTDAAGGLAAALEVLAESHMPAANRAVYLISDFQRNVWIGEKANGGVAQPTDTTQALRRVADALAEPAGDLNLIRVEPAPASNLAVTDLSCDSRLVARDIPVRILAHVAGFGTTAAPAASLQFRLDGRVVRREPLPRTAPGEATAVTTGMLFTTPGTHVVEARLMIDGGDALADDDVRLLSVEVREFTNVLLVDSRPGSTPLEGNAGFLATALSPEVVVKSDSRGAGSARGLVATKTVTPADLATEPLPDYEVVALCNVPRLSPDDWNRLSRFVEAGGGLLVFGGDQVNIENYNRYGFADGRGLIPARLEAPKEARGRQPGDGVSASDFEGAGLSSAELSHPVVADFKDQPSSGIFLARVQRYHPVTTDPVRAQVVLRLSNGDPALVAGALGRGRVLLFTTSANMDWTNLPAKGDYVSLMLSAVSHLAAARDADRNLLVGQVVREPLTAVESAQELRIVTGDGNTLEPEIVPSDGGLTLQSGSIDKAGLLTVAIGAKTRKFAVNTDPSESDAATAAPHEISAHLATPVRWLEPEQVDLARGGGAPVSEFGGVALYLATLLLLGELWLGMWFSSARGGSN